MSHDPEPTETSDRLRADARRLATVCAERAADVEQARRVPADLSQAMAEAGFYRLFVPAHVGGLEVAPRVACDVFETLARADASCAWVAFIAATGGSVLAAVPDDAARAIFARQDIAVTGVVAPSGRATRVDGGYRVRGRWQWGSGVQNADWVVGGCRLYADEAPLTDDAGTPRTALLILPARAVTVQDTWHVAGLRGSGSHDFSVQDEFVPDERVVGAAPGSAYTHALYRFPQFTLLALGIAAIALGIARASIDDLVVLAGGKRRFGSARALAERTHSQLEVAQAEARLRSARAFFHDALGAAWDHAANGTAVPLVARRDLRLATTHAVQSAVSVTDAMYTLAGGAAVYDSSSLQRRMRDAHVLTQHIMVAPATLEVVGRLYLGLEGDSSML